MNQIIKFITRAFAGAMIAWGVILPIAVLLLCLLQFEYPMKVAAICAGVTLVPGFICILIGKLVWTKAPDFFGGIFSELCGIVKK